MTQLSCASFQARTSYGDLLAQMQITQRLKEGDAAALEYCFGLSKPGQASCYDHYTFTRNIFASHVGGRWECIINRFLSLKGVSYVPVLAVVVYMRFSHSL